MGTFEYMVVPFGTQNGPAHFQNVMNIILGDKHNTQEQIVQLTI